MPPHKRISNPFNYLPYSGHELKERISTFRTFPATCRDFTLGGGENPTLYLFYERAPEG